MRPRPRSASDMRARPSSAASTAGYSVPRHARTWPRSRLKPNRRVALTPSGGLFLQPPDSLPPDILVFVHIAQDIAACRYHTGIDPFTKQQVYVTKGLRDKKMQRPLMQFFKPENWLTVREAILQTGRQDLIGGCEGLIPANQPKEALEKRRGEANWAVQGDDHY